MVTQSTAPGIGRTARVFTRAMLLVSKHLWVWPLLGAVVLVLVGTWVRSEVDRVTRAEVASRLTALLNADIAALRLWFSERESDARSFAADIQVQGAVSYLAELAQTTNATPAALTSSAAATTLQMYLKPLLGAQNYFDYMVISPDRRIIASLKAEFVGRPAPKAFDFFFEQVMAGEVGFLRPFARESGSSDSVDPVSMFVAAPVRSSTGKIIAVLALSIKPEDEFSRIFSVARMGRTGESYAFDRRGMMLTASRFDKQLKALRLIPNTPGATAILNLRLLDPGVDLSVGEISSKPRSELPLTRMAKAAVMGEDGYDVQGYRNYRGVLVVGAWAWLPEFRMGVATEVAAEEAFSTLHLLRKAFLVLFLLLVLSGLAIFAFTLIVERLQASIRRSTLNTGRVGQYVLVQEIGQGANGMVYRARHSLLRRPVAIKLLSPEMTNETTAARFEHEVQMTSQLTHPNTVAIYDYGRTPEGVFYCAMEYLSGINLDQLIRQFGAQPHGRVIHVLRQVCGSLAEAHRIGLIHRDVKPANIVLTRRGGLCDVVKVLDFGLVKVRHSTTADKDRKTIVGTPHFISPEAIRNPDQVDPRSDLYSVGAVGFWLLTGKTLFESDQVNELLNRQMWLTPVSPSERLGREIPPDLEKVIMRCLSKSPDQRPASAQELEQDLARCCGSTSWTAQDAEGWWTANMAGIESMPPPATPEKTLIIQFR